MADREPWPPGVQEEVMIRSRRSCCICNEFTGRPLVLHHIIQAADGGASTVDNAIALCERCHGEVGHYNARHPLGTKYKPDELTRHRDGWWAWCRSNPNKPILKSPITVSPTELVFVKGGWRQSPVVRIHNRTPQSLFQIWLQVIPHGLKPTELRVRVTREHEEQTVRAGPLEMGGDGVGAYGLAPAGTPCVGLQLTSVDPGETIRLHLGDKGQQAGDTSWTGATVLLESFSEDPLLPRQGDNQFSYPFTRPDFLTKIEGVCADQRSFAPGHSITFIMGDDPLKSRG